MRVYIFEHVSRVSDNYHDGGSLLVVADNRDHVREQIDRYNANAKKVWGSRDDHIALSEADWERVRTWELAGEAPEYLMAFPDSGCCG